MDVALEIGPRRRVFATACDWIGWSRAGRDEAGAIAALYGVAARYAAVAAAAGLGLTAPLAVADLEVSERIAGTAVTDFGALSRPLTVDQGPLDDAAVDRLASLLVASWAAFDTALAGVPKAERTDKPSTGRSPAQIRLHVLETDRMHLSAFGPAFRRPNPEDPDGFEAPTRDALLAGLRGVPRGVAFTPQRRYGFAWTPAFAARRAAWHAIDHAWELEDRVSAARR